MAREYAFTRTVKRTIVTALVCDTESAELCNKSFSLLGTNYSANKLEKLAAKYLSYDNYKFVSIVDVDTDTKLMGMTEDDFFMHAVELDPKTRQPIAKN